MICNADSKRVCSRPDFAKNISVINARTPQQNDRARSLQSCDDCLCHFTYLMRAHVARVPKFELANGTMLSYLVTVAETKPQVVGD